MSRISETSLHTELSLTVADLAAAVRFYTVLFDVPPVRHWPAFARFQIDEPPLVLTLRCGDDHHAGAVNHVGFRLEDSAPLVAIQHRLELAGYATEREDGVECCYSRQTKFWAADPDGNLWEIYSLEDDPSDQPSETTTFADTASNLESPVVWGHRAGEPLCLPIPFADGTVDEVHLDRTLDEDSSSGIEVLREALRVLKTGGTLAAGIDLPRCEAIPEALTRLIATGFSAARVERWRPSDNPETPTGGLLQASAVKPGLPDEAVAAWMYRGPGAEVELDDGRTLRRAQRVINNRNETGLISLAAFAADVTAFPGSNGNA